MILSIVYIQIDYDCPKEFRRGHAINGQDPYFPWFSLGNDTGLDIISLARIGLVRN